MVFFQPHFRGCSPWSELEDFQSEVRRLFPTSRGQVSAPRVNVWSGEDRSLLVLQVPGFGKDDIDVEALGDRVTVKGTRESKKFERAFQFPFQVDTDGIEARARNGVLEVSVPRKQTVRKITVQSA